MKPTGIMVFWKGLLIHSIGDEINMSNYAIIFGVDKYKYASALPSCENVTWQDGKGKFVY